MYARRAAQPRPRSSILKGFPAPVGGWVANRNLAQPAGNGLPQGAAILDNYFPLATSVILRRGSELYATLNDATEDVLSAFSYNVGTNKHLFAATAAAIYDITTIVYAEGATIGDGLGDELGDGLGDVFGIVDVASTTPVYDGLTGGDWVVVQFATTGGTYLIGVNGEDDGFIFDGTTFYPNVAGGIWGLDYDGGTGAFTVGQTVTGGTSAATGVIVKVVGDATSGKLWLKTQTGVFQDNEAITDPVTGAALANGTEASLSPGVTFSGALTSADMSYVWVYQNRLFFIQKNSLTGHYMDDVDVVGGNATAFPLGGTFGLGGSLLFGQAWSLDSGNSGGLSEQCIFTTTEGEVAVFQGSDPDLATDWGKVGVYKIGKPLGHKAFIRAGGDLVIATSIGAVPLSQAIQRDLAALSPSAVSYQIEEAWNEAIDRRGLTGWFCKIWAESQMVLVVPPTIGDETPVVFVVNARTGAWSRFTGWHAHCMEVFNGELYFGSANGKVIKGGIGGTDQGDTYTGVYAPLFEDFENPAALKLPQLARLVLRGLTSLNSSISAKFDFDLTVPTAPQATPVPVGSEWGVGIWGEAVWGAGRESVVSQKWKSVGGQGYAVSFAGQLTSGSTVPLDAEIIRLECLYQVADVLS